MIFYINIESLNKTDLSRIFIKNLNIKFKYKRTRIIAPYKSHSKMRFMKKKRNRRQNLRRNASRIRILWTYIYKEELISTHFPILHIK